MKSTRTAVVLAIVLMFPLYADPVLHKFEFWGNETRLEKLSLYVGWMNGFLAARGQRGLELGDCLAGMTYGQAIAMIDKRYTDHPELWSHPLGEQILDALTIDGGPCKGKNPLSPMQ